MSLILCRATSATGFSLPQGAAVPSVGPPARSGASRWAMWSQGPRMGPMTSRISRHSVTSATGGRATGTTLGSQTEPLLLDQVFDPLRPPGDDVLLHLVGEDSVGQENPVLHLPQVDGTDLLLHPLATLIDKFGMVTGDSIGEPDLVTIRRDLEVHVEWQRRGLRGILHGPILCRGHTQDARRHPSRELSVTVGVSRSLVFSEDLNDMWPTALLGLRTSCTYENG